jgi:hemoglobin-like flavoprotein
LRQRLAVKHCKKCFECLGEQPTRCTITAKRAARAISQTQPRLKRTDDFPDTDVFWRAGQLDPTAAPAMADNEACAHQLLCDFGDVMIGQALFCGEMRQSHGSAFPGENNQKAYAEIGVLGELHATHSVGFALASIKYSIYRYFKYWIRRPDMRVASPSAMAIVKATAPAIEKHGVEITTAMYARLFRNSEVAAMFDRAAQASGEQPRRLANAILAYAKNIDRLENLGPAVERMVARHVETGVKAEHYPLVAEALLPAIREVLGAEVATDEVLGAWGEAYWMLADILIAAEAQAYEDAEAA